MKSATRIYLSLGSNIEPKINIACAIDTLKERLQDCEVSPLYQSGAVGMQGPDFINAVVSGQTELTLAEVIQWLTEIELQQDRIRTANKFSDRTLDLDLLLYGDICNEHLPHAELTSEAYVLQPLYDIAPDLIHPASGRCLSSLREELLIGAPEKFNDLQALNY